MPEVLDWQRVNPRAVLQRSLEVLTAGGLVAFPTETGYYLAAAALCTDAVARLRERAADTEEPDLSVAVRDSADALDWVPGMSRLGQRLARRCWPGPVVLVFGATAGEGVASRLPEEVRAPLLPIGSLRLCMPGHDAVLQTLNSLSGPMVLAGIRDGTGRMALTADLAVQTLGDAATLVIDDGPSEHLVDATTVRVNGQQWEIVREGAISGAVLEQMSPCRILFVCTGNTCRSPLAEGLCKKLLAERLGCTPDELPARGFIVQSAGLAAILGAEPAHEAVDVARELGADLSRHRSQPLSADLLVQADYVIAMTRSHIRTLSTHVAGLGPEPRLLSGNGEDLSDPIGCDRPVYSACAQEIVRHLARWVPEVLQFGEW
jgi:protein-tyrosine-phosphatase/tRNA A37 threonylcarbamoyladenosine synthetase subunit TsaC/SUA5/YrdC